MFRRRPDFIVLGTQKGGTTSLFRYLVQHPLVIPAERKEVGFFSDLYDRGLPWYRGQFPRFNKRVRLSIKRRGWIRTGEATPYYLFHPLAAERIRAFDADMKMVVMLRDPVERAYSHYRHHVKLGEETLSFEAAIEAEPDRLQGEEERMLANPDYEGRNYRLFSYLTRGQYAEQLERFFERFQRSQFLILSSEAFFADPAGVFERTQRFLGLPLRPRNDYEQFNPGHKAAIETATRERLQNHFRPHNERLFRLLGEDYGWNDA